MAKVDHIVLCGGASASRVAKTDQIVRLDLGGKEPNVDLKIIDISRRLSSDVPDGRRSIGWSPSIEVSSRSQDIRLVNSNHFFPPAAGHYANRND